MILILNNRDLRTASQSKRLEELSLEDIAYTSMHYEASKVVIAVEKSKERFKVLKHSAGTQNEIFPIGKLMQTIQEVI